MPTAGQQVLGPDPRGALGLDVGWGGWEGRCCGVTLCGDCYGRTVSLVKFSAGLAEVQDVNL